MELEKLLELIPKTIKRNGYNRSLVLRYSGGLKQWVCHHRTSKHNIGRKISKGTIAVGETPKAAVENYIKNNTDGL